MDRVKIFGINIENTTLDDVVILLEKKLDEYGLFTIATPNTEIA
ncbi:MAG: glycosyltransferase, partial [Tissierellia bacterium]|nr:glycosyltransferase [Tissierellia bacterium]NLW42881.1 glycosyltransferase [Tissierellia bacterium]